MKNPYLQNKLLSILIFVILFTGAHSQNFKQIVIKKDSIATYIAEISTTRRLNAFGNFRYNLFLTVAENTDKEKDDKYRNYYVSPFKEGNNFGLFTLLDTETGKFEFLNINYKNYLPISFLNNDTLVIKLKTENAFKGYRVSDQTIVTLLTNIQELLNKVPEYYENYRFKVNNAHEKMVLLSEKEEELDFLKIYFFENNVLLERKIESKYYCKSWKFLDISWIDNDNLLLFLAKPMEKGIEFSQKIYNIREDKITDLILPKKDYILDDYYNGFCLIRTEGTPPAYIYRLCIDHGKAIFRKSHQINAEIGINNPLYELGFVSESKIARITDVEAEKGFFSIFLNLEHNNYLKIEISEIQ